MSRYYGMCLATFKDPNYSQGRRKCVGRRMLTKKPAEYLRPPKCPHCGGTKWYIDKQIRKRHARENCYCGGYHHIHRRGSKYCEHNANYEANWEERLR